MDNKSSQHKPQYVRTQESQAENIQPTPVTTSDDSSGNEDMYGYLPCPAPLAVPFVPYQRNNPQKYQPSKGIVRGTLFPGLDLPFRAMVNEGELWDTPLAELMALDFAIKELQLYLDTHAKDTEVLQLLQSYIAMQKEGTEKYVQLYGPIGIEDVETAKSYTWVKDPWPWEYTMEGDN